jgi:hypothetical protein
MTNIMRKDEIDKDDWGALFMQAYTRLSAVSAMLGAFRKLFEGEGLRVIVEAPEKDSHEALAIVAEHVTGEAITIINGLHDAGELWEARAKECGWKSEGTATAAPASEHAEEHATAKAARDREQKALVELALSESTPTEAIRKARTKLHMLCLKAKDDR